MGIFVNLAAGLGDLRSVGEASIIQCDEELEMGEKVEDSKLVKFRMLLNEVDKNFPRHQRIDNAPPQAAFKFYEGDEDPKLNGGLGNLGIMLSSKPYDLSICNEYRTNPFVEAFCKYFSPTSENSFSDLSILVDKTMNILNYRAGSYEVDTFSTISRLIFWLLFVAAIDDEFYNKELSTVIDFAYCAKFNEGMIRDWCRAVEYVLSGNRFSKNCDLEMETAEGKKFFIESYGCQNN